MSGNTRGKLKEHFEGIHRNFDWTIYHCQKAVVLIADKNPALLNAVNELSKGVQTLDKITQDLYTRL